MFPKIGEGQWADAAEKGRTLRLFSSVTELGWVGSVFDVDKKDWISREWADDLEQGKTKRKTTAQAVLKAELDLNWKNCP